MQSDKTQLFNMEFDTRCDTFGCGESAAFMIGRPDGPLNATHNLCDVCTDSLVESVKETFDLHAKAVHAPVENDPAPVLTIAELITAALEDVRSHAELDQLIKNYTLKGIPKRDEEGGKLQERKEAIQKEIATWIEF